MKYDGTEHGYAGNRCRFSTITTFCFKIMEIGNGNDESSS